MATVSGMQIACGLSVSAEPFKHQGAKRMEDNPGWYLRSFPEGMPDGFVAALAARNVYAASRLGRLRISPHVYNDETDCERLADAVQQAMAL